MFSKIIGKLRYKLLLKWIKPEILSYKDDRNCLVPLTGVSNMSHVSNKNNVLIGDNVFIGHFNYVDGYDFVRIGSHVQITNYVSVLTHSSHHSLRFINSEINDHLFEKVLKSSPVEIGDFSYIGAHSVIMPGTKIGKGSIVSAFSYVNGEFPDYAILRGQPAKIIGYTNDIDKDFILKYPELEKLHYEFRIK